MTAIHVEDAKQPILRDGTRTGGPQWRGLLLLGLYLGASVALTVHNKWVLSGLMGRACPWLLSALHISASGLGGWLVGRIWGEGGQEARLGRREHVVLALFSSLYGVNLALSNVGLSLVSLAFHQIVRAAGPLATMLLEMLLLSRRHTLWAWCGVVPAVLGVVLVVWGESVGGGDGHGHREGMVVTGMGTVVTVLGMGVASLKGVMCTGLLTGPLRMQPLTLLWRVAPLAAAQCLAVALLAGELGELGRGALGGAVLTALLAFLLNWLSFSATQHTSALSLAICGNIKQVAIIAAAVLFFQTRCTWLGLAGMALALLGSAVYRYGVGQCKGQCLRGVCVFVAWLRL